MKKKRTMIQLTPMQLEFLDKEQERLGVISRSELIRRIIDKHIHDAIANKQQGSNHG